MTLSVNGNTVVHANASINYLHFHSVVALTGNQNSTLLAGDLSMKLNASMGLASNGANLYVILNSNSTTVACIR